jgi:hypothetical protein
MVVAVLFDNLETLGSRCNGYQTLTGGRLEVRDAASETVGVLLDVAAGAAVAISLVTISLVSISLVAMDNRHRGRRRHMHTLPKRNIAEYHCRGWNRSRCSQTSQLPPHNHRHNARRVPHQWQEHGTSGASGRMPKKYLWAALPRCLKRTLGEGPTSLVREVANYGLA